MTVPAERADRLPEEARSFVNEFDPRSTPPEPAAPGARPAHEAPRPERDRMIAGESEDER